MENAAGLGSLDMCFAEIAAIIWSANGARRNKEGLPIIDKTIYRDVFNFHEERLAALEKCPDSALDAFWDRTNDTMIEISGRHNRNLFCVEMLVAVHADLERRYQRRWMHERSN